MDETGVNIPDHRYNILRNHNIYLFYNAFPAGFESCQGIHTIVSRPEHSQPVRKHNIIRSFFCCIERFTMIIIENVTIPLTTYRQLYNNVCERSCFKVAISKWWWWRIRQWENKNHSSGGLRGQKYWYYTVVLQSSWEVLIVSDRPASSILMRCLNLKMSIMFHCVVSSCHVHAGSPIFSVQEEMVGRSSRGVINTWLH